MGLLLTALVAGAAVVTAAVGTWRDRLGRRRVYAGLFLTLAGVGTVFALTDILWMLLLAALSGIISTEVVDRGPFTSLEQPILAGLTTTGRHPAVHARYNAAAPDPSGPSRSAASNKSPSASPSWSQARKSVYDLTLWARFWRIPLAAETTESA